MKGAPFRVLAMPIAFSATVAGRIPTWWFDLLPCQPDDHETCGADMTRVNTALVPAESLWAFITSTDTGYFERTVVAQRGSKLIPVQWIPRLLEAERPLIDRAREMMSTSGACKP